MRCTNTRTHTLTPRAASVHHRFKVSFQSHRNLTAAMDHEALLRVCYRNSTGITMHLLTVDVARYKSHVLFRQTATYE